jgi:hypothetical protein
MSWFTSLNSRLGLVALLAATGLAGFAQAGPMAPAKGPVRIVLLHHSTGWILWEAGLPRFFKDWNQAHGTRYQIDQKFYPDTTRGKGWLLRIVRQKMFDRMVDHYPWENYPYDYWNLWVAHTGGSRDRGELNLDDLAKDYDVIIWKHCYPVSNVIADDGRPSVSSPVKTLANYQLQYEALKERMHQFPGKRFIVWTPTALPEKATNPEDGARANQFSEWVKQEWDTPGDNIFVWDWRQLETGGGPYLQVAKAENDHSDYPSPAFAAEAAALLGHRIIDVIEGRGDQGSLTGQ